MLVEKCCSKATRGPRRIGQTAVETTLHDAEGHESCPSGLMRSSKTSPIVSVEELVEPDIILEVGIAIELDATSVRGTATVRILRKYVDCAMLDLFRDPEKIHLFSATRWALNLEFGTVELMEALERLDEEEGCR